MVDADLRSVLTVLDVAIQTEKDGREFYARAAEKTGDPGGKVLFTSLADDELEHLHLLETQREALIRDGHWLPHLTDAEEALPTKVEGAPIFSREAVGQDISFHTTDLSALRMAFLIERDAVAFYTKAAAETKDPDGSATYGRLVEMEKEHQRILEEEYNALAEEFRSTMGFEPF